MATPSRNDRMIKNLMEQHKKDKVIIPHYNEEAEYKHLLWDYEHQQLSEHKKQRFEELREKYGK